MGFLSTDADALSWAALHFAFDGHVLIQARPWGRTFRLHGSGETAYLKLCAVERPIEPVLVPLLGACFPGQVPVVRAADAQRGTLLSGEFAGTVIDAASTVEDVVDLARCYGRLQGRARQIPQLLAALPFVPLSGLIRALLEFLEPGSLEGARHWLSGSEAAILHRIVSTKTDVLMRLVANAERLPATINHCDLHFGNVARTAEGTLILFDWSDAVAGPAGMSLSSLFGSCLELSACAHDLANDRGPGRDDLLARGLDAYATALSREGYAIRPEILFSLPASALLGLIRNTVDTSLFRTEEPASRAFLGDLVGNSLEDVVATLEAYEREG